MPITHALEQWLINSGYEYHCFISWPHTKNKHLTECARRLKEAIEESLALSIASPKVFLDEDVYGGADWQETLLRSLCRSVSMVSICAPIYYHPLHNWCGLEWAAMHGLSTQRIPNAEFKTIIPVLIKKDDSLPEAISQIQYIDISSGMVRGRRYYSTNDFRGKVEQIVDRIEQIARALQSNSSITSCEQFPPPPCSAFANHQTQGEQFPFRCQLK
jgi:hypothetical protein